MSGILGNPLILMLIMMVPILLLSTRRNKKEQQARQSLKKGDRVVSDAGLVGELVELGDRFSKVKLGPGITVEMVTARIAPLNPTAATADAKKDDKLQDLKDAKAVTAEGKK